MREVWSWVGENSTAFWVAEVQLVDRREATGQLVVFWKTLPVLADTNPVDW